MSTETINPGDPRAHRPHAGTEPRGFVRSGKVRDLFDVGDREADAVCSSRAIGFPRSTSFCRPRSRTRAASSPACRVSGSPQTQDIIPNHLLGLAPNDLPAGFTDAAGKAELKGRMMLCRRGQGAAGRGHRPRLCRRVRMEGLQADRSDLRHRAACRPSRVRSAARADLHSVHQGRSRARPEHRLRLHGRAGRRPSSPRRSATSRFASTSVAPKSPRRPGSWLPTRSSSSGSQPGSRARGHSAKPKPAINSPKTN